MKRSEMIQILKNAVTREISNGGRMYDDQASTVLEVLEESGMMFCSKQDSGSGQSLWSPKGWEGEISRYDEISNSFEYAMIAFVRKHPDRVPSYLLIDTKTLKEFEELSRAKAGERYVGAEPYRLNWIITVIWSSPVVVRPVISSEPYVEVV